MRAPVTGPLNKPLIWMSVALLVLAFGSMALARGGYHHAQTSAPSAPPCGVAAGGLPDPADTQRCLAERYKAAKPKPQKTDGEPAANATAGPPS